jgi:hypothetical protein
MHLISANRSYSLRLLDRIRSHPTDFKARLLNVVRERVGRLLGCADDSLSKFPRPHHRIADRRRVDTRKERVRSA